MGGNALKIAKTRRYSQKEFFEAYTEIRKILCENSIANELPRFFANKETFGDIDILILNNGINFDGLVSFIKEKFNPTEIYRNNPVVSFNYGELQTDFILVSPENWRTSITYFSFNDLGNLIGRISYKMGFRYGDYGLKLVYRHEDGGKKFEKIISKDASKIFEFLGFGYNKYNDGFQTVEEIFDYVVNSKYFNPKLFEYSELNHQNRTRNKKRVNYANFLEYIKDLNENDYYQFENKTFYIKKAEEFFNIDIINEIDLWKVEMNKLKEATNKFNGNLIMEKYPELKDKELGATIEKLKKYVTSRNEKSFNEWLFLNNENFIWEVFKKVNNLN
jgi:hypothetical protein